jgi:hypothetical protein
MLPGRRRAKPKVRAIAPALAATHAQHIELADEIAKCGRAVEEHGYSVVDMMLTWNTNQKHQTTIGHKPL